MVVGKVVKVIIHWIIDTLTQHYAIQFVAFVPFFNTILSESELHGLETIDT